MPKTTKKRVPTRNLNIIHQACKHIDYRRIITLPQRDLYILEDNKKNHVALVEIEENTYVTITQ